MSSNDWDTLMNGVFGSRGRFTGSTGEAAKPAPEKPAPKADPLAALQRNADAMTEALQRQAQELADLGLHNRPSAKAQRAEQQAAEAAALSGQLTRELAKDGLLPQKAPDPAEGYTPAVRAGFAGLADALNQTVLGQEAFIRQLCMAFRRPYVTGVEGNGPKNAILIWGPEGTGRHFALRQLAAELARRGLAASENVTTMDLALYPGPAQEKLFLQDLYAALNDKSGILAFDHYEGCHPSFLRLLACLVQDGAAPLGSRYVLQKGILVDAGTALVADAVKSLPARGKYLVFFSEKGPDALSDRFGAGFAAALGDVCAAAPLAPESRTALAAQQLNALAQRCKARLGLTLAVDPAVRDEAAACYSRQNGSKPILAYVERIFRSLTQYTLEYDPAPGTRLEVKPGEGGLVLAPESGEAIPLARLLPAGGSALAQVEAELNEIVGLAPIKDYVLSLKDNVLVQQRRKEQGLKSAAVSMHMIFAGNPGTGKTTIARLVSKYLKAIGALGGGQLVEVSRADLVGRYVGHTAPLVNQVISTALGGVLFIDEAYSLYRGEQDSFGLEAIDTLVKGMEDHRDELVVVLAGYTKEMQEFLTANSGLASRFPNFIEFPDYTADELLRITRLQAKGKGYRMEDACNAPLLAYYARRQAEDAATAGNGRLARNKLEQAILNQSRRLVAEPNAPLDLLLWTDFELEE